MTINNHHQFKFIADGQKFKGLVLHSKKDRVLRYLFRGGEATTNLPLIAGFTPRIAGGAWPSLSPAKYIKSFSSKVSEFISPRFF